MTLVDHARFTSASELSCPVLNTFVVRAEHAPRVFSIVVNSCFPGRKEQRREAEHDSAAQRFCQVLFEAAQRSCILL